MPRFEGDRPELDHSKQLEFFERRAATATPGSSHAATSFSGAEEAEHRHAAEVAQVAPLLHLGSSSVVLDVGCGGARWGLTALTELDPPVERYVGVDFSPKLVSLAKSRNLQNGYFYVMPADELDSEQLGRHGPYTHCIVTAVCLYMNDISVARMLASIADLLPTGGTFYWREPISLTGKRLTLIDEFSQKIGDDYNAAYRTPEEYQALVEGAGAFDVITNDFLSDTTFQRHATTRHRYLVAQRR